MTEYKCEYCNRCFTRRSNLTKHQKQAQYCLAIQTEGKFQCDGCGKYYSRLFNLNRHHTTCKGRAKEILPNEQLLGLIAQVCEQNNQGEQLMLRKFAQMQESLLKMLIERPNATFGLNRNVNMMNMQPLTDEHIQGQLSHLTLDFITDGAKGYATFANDYPFKDMVVCTDRSRRKIKYKGPEGDIIEDGGGARITQMFFSAIEARNEELINKEYRSLQMEVKKIADEGTASTKDVTGILSKASRLQDLLAQCKGAAQGQENELTKEFITHLSRML